MMRYTLTSLAIGCICTSLALLAPGQSSTVQVRSGNQVMGDCDPSSFVRDKNGMSCRLKAAPVWHGACAPPGNESWAYNASGQRSPQPCPYDATGWGNSGTSMFHPGVPYELKLTPRGSTTLGSSEEMIVSIMSEKGDLATVFHLRKGGCLRGPVDFYTRDGKPLYHVDVGQSVPAGCDRH